MNRLEKCEYKGYRLKLYPDYDQEELLKEYFGASRFVYNFGINLQKNRFKDYDKGLYKKKTIGYFEMTSIFNSIRKEEKYKWLNKFDNGSLNCIFRDVTDSFKRYFKGLSKKPKYKKKKWANQMFSVRSDRLSIQEDTVKLPSIGIIKCDKHGHPEIIGTGYSNTKKSVFKHYNNVRVSFDGCDYWLSFALPISDTIKPNSCYQFIDNEIWNHKPYTHALGMDINAHHDAWIVLSDNTICKRPNTYKDDKRINKYQRKLDIKRKAHEKEKKTNSALATKLKEQNYTKNEEKLLKKLNKAYKHRTNKKIDKIHNFACDILRKKPEYLVMETLNVKSMFLESSDQIPYKHRKNHNQLISSAMIDTVQRIISDKLIANGIPVYKADKNYPSSQLCSSCGYRQKIGTKREYVCPHCGNIIDRDLNAAINLENYFNNSEYVLKIS